MTRLGAEERQLVERMCAGDESAFDTFARGYLPGLYRFAASRMTGELDQVQDLVQQAAIKAIENLASFRGEASLFTWLCACCRNEISSFYRRRGRRPEETLADDADQRVVAGEPLADERLMRIERSELVHAALDLLPAGYAGALRAKYFEGSSVQEIAERTMKSPKAVESLLSRARHAFREAFSHLEEAGATAGSAEEGEVQL